MDTKITYKINDVVQITKTHVVVKDIKVTKGQIGKVGELQSNTPANHIPVQFTKDGPYFNIDSTYLKNVTDKAEQIYEKSCGLKQSIDYLRVIEQKYRDMNLMTLAETFNRFRRELYIKHMKQIFNWTETECFEEFFETEEYYKEKGLQPYKITLPDNATMH